MTFQIPRSHSWNARDIDFYLWVTSCEYDTCVGMVIGMVMMHAHYAPQAAVYITHR